MSQWLSQRLGQQFVVENRLGAGGNVATETVISAAPDGYTLLLITTSNAINAAYYRKLPFNFMLAHLADNLEDYPGKVRRTIRTKARVPSARTVPRSTALRTRMSYAVAAAAWQPS